MLAKPDLLQCLKAGLIAGVTAALINALLFFIFSQAGVITDNILLPDNSPMTVVPVILFSLIPSLLASLVYYLLARYTANGYRYFTIIAVILLILSFANPFFGIPGVTVPYAVALNVMHVVVVACLLYALRRFTLTSVNQA
jgi:hypothetical protein